MAELTFAHPGILWAASLAALPVLIHLLLRPRPRRARFPAVALLLSAFAAGQRANRLRNFLLLAARALLIGLATLLLAGPTCLPRAARFVGTDPVACAILIDDSASMTYRLDGESTILDRMCAQARNLIDSASSWPERSAFLLLTASMTGPPIRWTTDRAAIADATSRVARQAPHARALPEALRIAAEHLRNAEQPTRRIVAFTDGAASAWRGVTPAVLAGVTNLAVQVVVPEESDRSNLAIRAAQGPARVHPSPARVPLHPTISVTGPDSQGWLIVKHHGRTLQSVGPLRLGANAATNVNLEIPPLPPGLHVLTLQLDPPDRLDFDQRCDVAVQTGPPPVVWLLIPEPTATDTDIAALLLQNLLAPELLPADQQLVELHVLAPSDASKRLVDERATRPALTVVLTGAPLPGTAAAALMDHARQGATVLLIPSSTAPEQDWPGLRPLLSPTSPIDEVLPASTGLRWEDAAGQNGNEGLAELARCAVRRRLRLSSLLEGVVVQGRYADDVPAIISKPIGSGYLTALLTSPDPSWGELGIRAAGLLTWLHKAADGATPEPTAIAALEVDQASRHRFPTLPSNGLVRVAPPASPEASPIWMHLTDGIPEKPWPDEFAGTYTITPAGDAAPAALYVVHWPPEESDLQPLELDQLRASLGIDAVSVGPLEIALGPDATGGSWWARRAPDLARVLGGLLLATFLVETVLSGKKKSPVVA